jgi:hypothetical protein
MSTDQEKKQQHSILLIGIAFLVSLQLIPFLFYMDYLPEKLLKSNFVIKASTPFYYYTFRLLYIVILMAIMNMFISVKLAKKMSKKDQPPYRNAYYLFSILILIGTIQHPVFYFYNLIFFPAIIIFHLFLASRGFAKLGAALEEEDPLSKINQKELKEMGLIFDTDKGKLHVHNVFQGMLVQGGAGAGKSASIIEPAIYQWALQNNSMTIYDFKGVPPTLGLMAYNSWLLPNKSKLKKPDFKLLSIDCLQSTYRPNPIAPKTLKNLIATSSVTNSLVLSLKKEWATKADFWAESAMNLCLAIAERLRKDPELHPFCTIPHLIYLGTLDADKLINWLREDFEIQAIIRSFITAQDNGASQQLGGMLSSFQSALVPLLSKELFWIFGAPMDEQDSLDINDPENPLILCIANDPPIKRSLSPILSCTMRAIINTINQQGKHPSSMVIDELPTLVIQDLAELPATARSNKVCTAIGIQDESQLRTQYDKQADEIIANMGNQFVGMTNNLKTAETYSKLFGTYKKQDTSHSTSDNSISFSDRLSNEKLMQEKDISQQNTGHFVGKIADGDPGLFSVQFDEFIKKDHFPNWKSKIEIPCNSEHLDLLFKNNPDVAEIILEQMVEINYQRICAECEAILSNY